MNFVYAIFIGVATALSATLIHQTLPPIGAIIAIVASYLAIWWVGRYTGKRRYKFFALSNNLGLQVWGYEYYTLVKGEKTAPFDSKGYEQDLFAGVDITR